MNQNDAIKENLNQAKAAFDQAFWAYNDNPTKANAKAFDEALNQLRIAVFADMENERRQA